ncbi:MAG: NAD(P)H-dependent glycerol-3-phosphate dehydrogenase [Candidatus Omnitrophota bacterium]|jgi:glycerol-3-phosphate dehydrogenase (NAD(P)+)
MTQKKIRVSILGDGGFGTALAVVQARKQNEVMLWSAFPEYAKVLRATRENPKFLPGVPLPEKEIAVTSDLTEALGFGDFLVFAIPSQYLRNILHKIRESGPVRQRIVTVAKGIEKKTLLRPSEIIRAVLPDAPPVVVLSGPSHAAEVARNLPTLMVAAAQDERDAAKVQEAFSDPHFRIYIQNDPVGVELGGALKNVLAIAVGICEGMKLGDNAKAGLISRALVEMTRFGIHLGANPNTFFGLSGLGDLVTTCFSPYGRNLKVGRELGQGRKIAEITRAMEMVAEGVDTAVSVHELAQKFNVSIPIMNEVYQILVFDKPVRQAVSDLLERHAHQELRHF